MTDKMQSKNFDNKYMSAKCGADIIGKIHQFVLWCVADIELTAFNEGRRSRQTENTGLFFKVVDIISIADE